MNQADSFNPGYTRERYQGPPWQNWLFAFAVSILIALEIRYFMSSAVAQSATSYYWKEPNVKTYHYLALLLDFLIIVWTTAWIFWPKLKKVGEMLIGFFAAGAYVLICIELIHAIKPFDRFYLLTELPFRPINNFGLWGLFIFSSYFILKLELRKLKPVWGWLMKLGLISGFAWIQSSVLFQAMEKFGL